MLMTELQRLNDRLFGHLDAAAFHHRDGVGRPGDSDVHIGVLELGKGRVDDQLTINAPNAHTGDRAGNRDIRYRHGRTGAGQRQDIGVVLLVMGDNERNALGFALEVLREQRANGAIDNTGGENLLLRRSALAFEEPAGDLTRGV